LVASDRLADAEELLAALGFQSMLPRGEVVPSAAFMRMTSQLARKGRLGLILTYLWRPMSLVGRTPRALLALRAARNSVTSRPEGDS